MRTLPLLLCLAAFAQAASVTWTTSTVSGPSDVNTAGTLVGAMEVGSATPRTINGVTFAADPTGAGTLALGSGTVAFGNLGSTFGDFWTLANPGGDAAYAAALDSGRWSSAATGTVTLGGLTVGRTYLVQLWITDTRSGANARIRTVDGVSTTSGGPNNIATGRFIANAATQVITLADVGGVGPAYQFTFPYRPGVTDLRYIVQRSGTLGGWTEIYRLDLATNQITKQGNVTADENPTTQIITLTDPDHLPGGSFWRLMVERP